MSHLISCVIGLGEIARGKYVQIKLVRVALQIMHLVGSEFHHFADLVRKTYTELVFYRFDL